MTKWNETFGCDERLTAASDVVIRSLTELETPVAVLMRDMYFDGADVLRCYSGRFRFVFDDEQAIELGEGDALVTYPGRRVTIEALERNNRIVYGVFCGSSVEAYLDSLGFYHGMHGKATSQYELFMTLRELLAELTGGKSERNPVCLSLMTDILMSISKELQGQGNAILGDAIRQIRANLAEGIVRIDPLCDQLKVSRAHLHSVFVQAGLPPPSNFIKGEQLRYALSLLRNTNLQISEIAANAGFITTAHFSTFIKKRTGKSPRDLRR